MTNVALAAMSIDEWLALPEDEPGELVDGVLEEEEVADWTHELVVTWLAAVLRAWLGARGFVGGSALKYVLSTRKGRKPDLSVVLPGSPPPPRRGRLETPPDVALEVVSPSPTDIRRDRVTKLREYARFGVRWYWIVDPHARTLEILERGPDGDYVHKLDATDGRVDAVPGCPGLVLDLDALSGELDRLAPEGE